MVTEQTVTTDRARERDVWETPEVRAVRAGEAENNNAVTFDGQFGLS